MTPAQDTGPIAPPRVWPATPADLVDTMLCPACFRRLGGSVCDFCGLDLSTPLSATLLELGRTMVHTENERQRVIGRIRADARSSQATRHGGLTPAHPDAVSPEAAGEPMVGGARNDHAPAAAVAASVDSSVAPVFAAPTIPQPTAEPSREPTTLTGAEEGRRGDDPVHTAGPPRRSGAQVLLLMAGVVLVSVCAIFFAVLAYVVASVETRSILTAAASLVVLGIAWVLRRRGLDGTAEGIAVIGVVLLLLDVWIVRVNRLFAADRLDVFVYSGLALLVVTAVLVAVSRVTSLRAPSVSAALIGPAGVFALVLGIARQTATESTAVLLGSAAATALILIEFTPRLPAAERVLLRAVSLVAGVVMLATAFFAFPSIGDGGAVIGFAISAFAWLAHLLTVERRRPADAASHSRAWAVLAAIGLALATAGGANSSVEALSTAAYAADGLRPAALASATALVLVISRATRSPLSRSLQVTAVVLAGIAAVSLVPTLLAILVPVGRALLDGVFRIGPLDAAAPAVPGLEWFVAGAAATSAASAGAVVVRRSARGTGAVAWIPAAIASLAVLGATVIVPSTVASVAVAAIGSSCLLAVSAARTFSGSARIAAFGCGLLMAAVTSGLSLASSGVWALGTLVGLAVLIAARGIAVTADLPLATAGAPASSALAVIVLLVSGGVAPSWVARVSTVADTSPAGFGTATAAVLILGSLAFVRRRIPRVELAVLASLAVLVLAPSALSVWALGDVDGDAGWQLALTTLALLGTAAWALPTPATPIRIAGASTAVPLLALLAADASVLGGTGAGGVPGSLAAAALLAVLSAALLLRRGDGRSPRAAAIAAGAELAIGGTAAAALVLALLDTGPLTRLTLLVIAVVPTLLAFRTTARTGPRRHLAWIGAVLAVAALWWFLSDERVSVVEFYSLPVAGLLLAVGGFVGLARRRHERQTAAGLISGLDVVVASALAVALLPSALVAADGGPVRATIIVAVGTALLLASLVGLRDSAAFHARSITWTAGVIAVALPVVVRLSSGAFRAYAPATALVGWLGAVAVVLIASALAVSRFRRATVLSDIAAMTAAAALGITVARAASSEVIGGADASPWLVIVCAITVAAVASGRVTAPPTPPTHPTHDAHHMHLAHQTPQPLRAATLVRARLAARATAIVGAVASLGIGAAAVGSLHDVEWVTVPLALAAIAVGAIRLSRDPLVGSWATLGPGLILLLAPSLAYDLGGSTLWRVIVVGVVSVFLAVLGARSRLQSPLIIGAAVTILHGLAQLWPWISGLYEAGYWWVWAGVGGVLLIAFAARYEQRMQNLRDVGRALRSLR